MQPAPSTGSRASGLRSGFAAVLTPRCFAPLLRPAPPCGALRASGLRSGFAAVLTPRCLAPFVAARSTLRGVAGFGAAEWLRRCPHPSVLRTLVAARSTLRGVAGFGAAERLRRCPHPSVLRTLVAARAIGISNHSAFHPCGALNLIAILQICRGLISKSAQSQQPAQLEHQRGQRPRQRRLGGNSSVGPAAAFHFPAHGRHRRHAGHIQKHEHQKGHRRQR